jgi:hypothetical protein
MAVAAMPFPVPRKAEGFIAIKHVVTNEATKPKIDEFVRRYF